MNKSNGIATLAKALNQFQAEVPTAKFDAQNPFLKNKYASLGAIIETSKPLLSKYGLSISQFPTSNAEGQVGVSTILMHDSGEWLEDTVFMTPEKGKGVNDAQSAGIAITYCRRYAWQSILGMVADEDTDAHVEGKKSEPKPEPKPVKERVFSLDALDAVVEVGVCDNHEDAKKILDHSVLSEDAPIKTIAMWLKKYVESGKNSIFECAEYANEAYLKAKSAKKEVK